MVSIIIPAYNQASYLRQAITSALTQSWRDLEVIVVDDGSTDETATILRAYHDEPRVQVFRQANAGVGAARNHGIAKAGGEYLCFLDADDWYHPEKVARQVEQLAGSPDIDWVYCDITPVNADGDPNGEYTVATARTVLSGDIFESLIVGGYFPPHTVMVRRAALAAVGGFDPDLGGNADYDLWLRLALAGHRVEFLPERLAYYRQYEGQMSGDPLEMRESARRALIKAARAAPERTASAIVAVQALSAELHAANQWLHGRWKTLLETMADMHRVEEPFDFLDHLDQSVLAPGSYGPPAIWDVAMAGKSARALLLHPPSTLTFTVPGDRPARFQSAVALHPDVWDRADCGPCEFTVSIDDTAGFWARLDPVANPMHRRWHECELFVPPSVTPRRVTLQTAAAGSNRHRWALWRTPRLILAGE